MFLTDLTYFLFFCYDLLSETLSNILGGLNSPVDNNLCLFILFNCLIILGISIFENESDYHNLIVMIQIIHFGFVLTNYKCFICIYINWDRINSSRNCHIPKIIFMPYISFKYLMK